jgi:excisionase family DNA binding protein
MTRYLTVEEVAEHFRVSATAVKRWIKAGRLPNTIDIGTDKRPTYRIPESSLTSVVRNAGSASTPEGVKKII